MKKLILVLLCLLVTTSVAMAYQVSGKIYNATSTTLTPVAGATGSISSGGSLNGITTSTTNNDWYGGWSQANMTGSNIRVTASKSAAFLYGSKTWMAASNTETGKDIMLKSSVGINPGLGIDLETVVFESHPMNTEVMAHAAVAENGYAVQNVVGFTAVVKFNQSKIQTLPPDFAIDSFFDITYQINIPEPGTTTIIGNIGTRPEVEILPGQSMELFNLKLEVLPFETRDLTVVDVDVSFDFSTPTFDPNAVPHQTEYLIGPLGYSDPYFSIETYDDWLANLDVNIIPLSPEEFEGYVVQWQDVNFLEIPELPYPNDPFLLPELYVYEGNESPGEPNDAGLVMTWGSSEGNDGNYTSAFKFDYKTDPDYTNCIITVTVIAPQFGPNPPHNVVNKVSLGLQNIPQVGGPVRAWYWNCGPGTSIPWNTPVTITIDTTKTGITAATPTATNYLNNPGFNIKTVQWVIVDENANWVPPSMGGQIIAPPPGGGIPGMWNYWQNLSVTPKVGGGSTDSKWFVKYSQPPILLDANSQPPLINGWDQLSDYANGPIMADDWICEDSRPITDIHWWGSFIGWNKPYPPQGSVPKGFHIGIWTDVPATVDSNSHPGQLIWENFCESYVWNYAGIDRDPRDIPVPDEACFQFAQFLSEDEWFYQEPSEDGTNIYWISISPIYDPCTIPLYQWGWKTRPHKFNDDACSITSVQNGDWPINIFNVWASGDELHGPEVNGTTSWDLAFELTTNEPAQVDDPVTITGDISGPAGVPDGTVNFFDLAEVAAHWLDVTP